MEPVLPPTFVTEFDSQRTRISNVERLVNTQTDPPYLLDKPAAINFVKYSRSNTNFDASKQPSKVDRIQSNWVSLPYPVNISTLYITHKTEHLNTPSFQDFYRCQIVVTSNDLQPPKVLSEFEISLNKMNNLRSNPKAGLWQDEPLESENDNERYFQYEKQAGFEIKLPEIISIPADRRFSLIKYPIFAREEEFSLLDDENLDIDVVVLNGLSSESINITVESTLIKKQVESLTLRTYTFSQESDEQFLLVEDEPLTLEEYETTWENYVNPALLFYSTGNTFAGQPINFESTVIYPNLLPDVNYAFSENIYPFDEANGFVRNYRNGALQNVLGNSLSIKHVISSPQNYDTLQVFNPKVIITAKLELDDIEAIFQEEHFLIEKTLEDYLEAKNNFGTNTQDWLSWLNPPVSFNYNFAEIVAYAFNETTKKWELDLGL